MGSCEKYEGISLVLSATIGFELFLCCKLNSS